MKPDPLLKSLTREAIEIAAPEELFLLDHLGSEQTQSPKTFSGPQGFGIEMGITLIAPVLYKFLEKLLERLVAKGAERTGDALLAWIMGNDSSDEPKTYIAIFTQLTNSGLDRAQSEIAARAIMNVLKGRNEIIVRISKSRA